MTAVTVRSGGAAARLRADSADIHRRTEDEAFIADLMGGKRSVDDYVRLVVQLRWVYATLEREIARARTTLPPAVVALMDPRLDRLAALDHDLIALGLDPSGELDPPLPETTAYLERIGAAADAWPRLVAHHYVRYMGDLSGGQIVASMMRRHYAVSDDALTFFAFDGIDSKGGYKTRYRAALDALLVEPADYAAALDETLAAYSANRSIFAALGAAGA
jgi:heme oxygenase (biliverdin-producing, ferredoxin)